MPKKVIICGSASLQEGIKKWRDYWNNRKE